MKKIFYIKNMVCDRCIKVVRAELKELPLTIDKLILGEAKVDFPAEKEAPIRKKLAEKLEREGFELIQTRDEQRIEQIKATLIKRVHQLPEGREQKLSQYLAENLNREYASLSKLFSQKQKLTIERFFIALKIERAKELIQNGQHNFSEISHLLDYSSLNHLSTQFKKHTGQSLSAFEKNPKSTRSKWDEII